MSSRTFWALVHHEFTLKGNRRKMSRSHFSSQWRVIYLASLVIIAIVAASYFAIHGQLQLNRLWMVAIAFPYILVVFGVAMLKREWDNETHGWWLSLPYSRLSLVGAKLVGAWLRVVVFSVCLYVLISLFAGIIAFLLPGYSAADVWSTMSTGLHLILIVIGFSPFILSISLLLASTHFTTLRTLSPVLWIVIVGGLSSFYNVNLFIPKAHPLGSEEPLLLWSFPWTGMLVMGISWIISYLLIRLTAYLLERKLNL